MQLTGLFVTCAQLVVMLVLLWSQSVRKVTTYRPQTTLPEVEVRPSSLTFTSMTVPRVKTPNWV